MEKFEAVKEVLDELSEQSGGCLITVNDESSPLGYCTIDAEFCKTELTGENLEAFKKAISLVDCFVLVPIDKNAFLISVSVFNVWQELETE